MVSFRRARNDRNERRAFSRANQASSSGALYALVHLGLVMIRSNVSKAAPRCNSLTPHEPHRTTLLVVPTKLRRFLCPCNAHPALFLFTVYGPTDHASAN